VERHNIYTSPNIVRIIKPRRLGWEDYLVRTKDNKKFMHISVGKLYRKKPLGRPSHRWNDNVEIHFGKKMCEGVHWTQMAPVSVF
jgi:hypothetical protein